MWLLLGLRNYNVHVYGAIYVNTDDDIDVQLYSDLGFQVIILVFVVSAAVLSFVLIVSMPSDVIQVCDCSLLFLFLCLLLIIIVILLPLPLPLLRLLLAFCCCRCYCRR